MLQILKRGLLCPWAVFILIVGMGLIGSSTAGAVAIGLNIEFDTQATGDFTSVEISEDAGALNFVISLNRVELGADSDLHEFYFNLVDGFTGLQIVDTNAQTTEYVLAADPSVAGGAGSNFDWGVHFGNGAGPRGNGRLQTASFTLTADQDLSLDDLLVSSFASGGMIEVQLAAHIQGTSALTGASSETIGGVIPIPQPATGPLLVSALGFLGWWSRRSGHRIGRTRSRV